MMVISICGASGFLGRQLESSLVSSYTVYPVSLRVENWSQIVQKDSSVIINLIGKAHDHKRQASEADYYHTNLDLAKDVFHAFLKSDATLLIHVSSIAAVEEFESLIPLEETHACNPVSWYGQSKRAAETWLLKQRLPEGKKLIILRPPMIHGAGDKGNLRLLYNIVSKGIPYPLSSFDNSRTFISIQNFVFYIIQIIDKQDQITSGIYHLADDENLSTKEIIAMIKEVTGRKTWNLSLPKDLIKVLAKIGDVVPIPLNTNRLKKMTGNMLVSNQKIKHALGIEKMPVSAKEGMMETLRSFR